jgi:hypothetical protein
VDRRVVQCNYKRGKPYAAEGARAYMRFGLPGLPDRAPVLVRSRSGRWIEHWEALDNLENFRFKTLPEEHPLYKDERIADYLEQDTLDRIAWVQRSDY